MNIQKTGNEEFIHKKYPDGFYMLSPDGFTLTPDAEKYYSIDTAKSDFEKWAKRYEQQGYYSSTSKGRIPLDELWDEMIFHSKPYFFKRKRNITFRGGQFGLLFYSL